VALRSLILEIDPSNEPVSGWLSDERGERRGFTGWLALAATLELMIDDTEPRASDERDDVP
jgi:hypothetical protein